MAIILSTVKPVGNALLNIVRILERSASLTVGLCSVFGSDQIAVYRRKWSFFVHYLSDLHVIPEAVTQAIQSLSALFLIKHRCRSNRSSQFVPLISKFNGKINACMVICILLIN